MTAMTELDRDLEQLHRYQDGELGGFERWRFERRLRGSEALQAELAAIRALSIQIARSGVGTDDGAESPTPDLWASIAAALPAIDAQVEDERARGAARTSTPAAVGSGGRLGSPEPIASGIPRWVFGSAALAAAATIALLLVLPQSTPPTGRDLPSEGAIAPSLVASPVGTVRYLDSGGRAVMVIEDPAESMTIVWTMDSV